jgi:hypothetical protein
MERGSRDTGDCRGVLLSRGVLLNRNGWQIVPGHQAATGSFSLASLSLAR